MERLLLWILHVLAFFLIILIACQAPMPPTTLEPGAVEVPFETVFLDEQGKNLEIEKEHQLPVLIKLSDVTEVQPLISTEALQQVQQVDFDSYSVIALFHPLGTGCAGFGVTIERLTLKKDILMVYANLWQPGSGRACAEEGIFSPYHLVKVRKAEIDLNELELILQNQRMERNG